MNAMVAALPFTAVAGLKVGHFTDPRRPTGCTVVLCESGAVAGVDVRGAAPGTRETELLAPTQTVEQVHAIVLAGGSAFGLDAASGVVRWLEERGVGLNVGPARVPIVPAAILFDLALGDPTVRPDSAAGYAACSAASAEPPAQGSIGAGAGATVGKLFGFERAMKGGIGHAALRVGGVTVAALVAVNAVGDVVDPQSGRIVAGARGDDGRPLGQTAALLRGEVPALALGGAATTIGVIATDARLTKVQATRLAQIGHGGLARTIDPVHTALDGDTLFALATGRSTSTADPIVLGAAAAAVVAQAVLNAVRHAAGVPGVPSARDLGLGDAAA
ncbi:MAG: P1 family peptidase [Burkholderiales bacterium]|nr:MAG: P1 family peptidase [Burkholderiales bacterium]